ncbi:hypothetical protein G6F56_011096 [Rhizopus delemar]|nr:hypothetical protein G6F56_011096 [Rhizopus delemar]
MWSLSRKLSSMMKQKSIKNPVENNQDYFKLNITSHDDVCKSILLQHLNLDLNDIDKDLYKFKLNSNNEYKIKLDSSIGFPKDIENLSAIFVCYDINNQDDEFTIKNQTVSCQIPCLFIGFQDAQISIITVKTHTLFYIDTKEDYSTLLKTQLLQCISTYSQSTRKSSSSTDGLTFEESPEDIVRQMIHETQDETCLSIFLMLYRKFMSPIQFLQLLIEEFEQEDRSKPESVHMCLQKR